MLEKQHEAAREEYRVAKQEYEEAVRKMRLSEESKVEQCLEKVQETSKQK